MTRVTTIIALTCFLVVGAAAASILGRDSVPGARLEMAAASLAPNPVSNKAAKQDKLAVASFALASLEPPQTVTLSEPLRQAFAAAGPADIVPPQIAAPSAPKPKVVAKPPVQKSYALLSDVQIAGIKERLKLSSSQESYWPAVETALRGIARKIHASRKADPRRPDRSRRRRSPAAEVGGDAAVVPAARGPEARSAHAGPHHRPGKSRLDDLRRAPIRLPTNTLLTANGGALRRPMTGG